MGISAMSFDTLRAENNSQERSYFKLLYCGVKNAYHSTGSIRLLTVLCLQIKVTKNMYHKYMLLGLFQVSQYKRTQKLFD